MQKQDIGSRNYRAMLIDGTFILIAFTFVDIGTVIPLFIHAFGGNYQIAGLAGTVRTVCLFLPQILIIPYLQSIVHVPSFVARTLTITRVMPMVFAGVILAASDSQTVLWLFFLLFSVLWIGEGLTTIPWLDVFSRTIPESRRGKLMGMQQVLGGAGSVLGGVLVKYLLDRTDLGSPFRFSMIFGIAGLLAVVSVAFLYRVHDSPRSVDIVRKGIGYYIRHAGAFFKQHPRFAKLALLQYMTAAAASVLPFIGLFGKNELGLASEQVTLMVTLQITGTLVGGFLWGSISQRMGNRHVILISQAIGLFIYLFMGLCLAGGGMGPVEALMTAAAFLAGIYSGSWLGTVNYMIDLAGEQNRLDFIVYNSIVTFPTSLIYYLAGVLLDRAGFVPLLLLGASGAALSVILSARLARQ